MAKYKNSDYTIDRKTASRLLKVSMRTVDRYIKAQHILGKTINGRIWLNKNQILDFRNRQRVKGVLSIDNYVDKVDIGVDNFDYSTGEIPHTTAKRGVDIIDGEVYVKSRGVIMDEAVQKTYRKLYENLLDKFNDRQTDLEAANYKIGALEARLKYSISLIDHRKEKALLLASGENLKKQLENEKKQKVDIYSRFRIERLNKRVYFILALILILLQPLWLLFVVW